MNEFNVLLNAATNGTPSGSLFDALFARYIAPQESWRELESPLPITILAAGEDLIDYRIYGNTEQTGTPTPENPIIPSGCGEKTENLFDKNAKDTANGYKNGKVLEPNGSSPVVSGEAQYITTEYIAIPNNTTKLTLVKNSSSGISGICFYDTNKEYISGESNYTGTKHAVIYCPTGAVYFRTVIFKQYIDEAMVVPGSTAPASYEPYGYVVPMAVQGDVHIDKSKGLYGYTIIAYTNSIVPSPPWWVSDYIPVAEGTTYTGVNTGQDILLYNEIDGTATGVVGLRNGYTIPQGKHYMRMTVNINNMNDFTVSVEYPSTSIYLGEAPTTRRIKKLVLTGDEAWAKGTYAFNSILPGVKAYNPVLCTHYQYYNGASSQAPADSISTQSGGGTSIWIKTPNHDDTTIEQWKSYLAAQYAAGTPVTVWYVLEEPETGIVNEPLMKIGDYADTVSMEQAGVSIPTAAGETIIDYNPSETPAVEPEKMYIKYKPQ